MSHLPLILASASPRRHQLLTAFSIDHIVVPSTVTEPEPQPEESPEAYCQRISEIKARSIQTYYPDRIILGADTIVTIDDEILGKPTDSMDSRCMLKKLSGRIHQVMTGMCLIIPKLKMLSSTEISQVNFRQLTAEEIQWYNATGDGHDKAGAYGIQSLGGSLIQSIDGDWFNVVGLPIPRLIQWLIEFAPEHWPPEVKQI